MSGRGASQSGAMRHASCSCVCARQEGGGRIVLACARQDRAEWFARDGNSDVRMRDGVHAAKEQNAGAAFVRLAALRCSPWEA